MFRWLRHTGAHHLRRRQLSRLAGSQDPNPPPSDNVAVTD